MKDTTNQFTKGLNKDLNPISMPADSMSDALNATFLTFNGNELSLQNDMGNTRLIYKYKNPVTNEEEVKKVQLRDGFVPVGIKEYGGILYIASYNPQEEKFQMGSFPSPEFRLTDLPKEEQPLFDEQTVEISTDNKLFDSSKQHIITSISNSGNIVLRPFDVITSYIFKDFNFEALSSRNDRRFYTYRLINTMNQQDITEHFDKSLFTNDVSYATFEVDNIDSFTVTLSGGTTKTFSKEDCNYSDEQLYCIKYRQKDKEVVSIYSYGQDIISIVPKFNSSQLKGDGSLIKTSFQITIHEKKDVPLSYPNIANGQIAIVFDVEKVDFFNIIHKGDNNKNVFGPKFLIQKVENITPLSLDPLNDKLGQLFKIVNDWGTKDFDVYYCNYREETTEAGTTYFRDKYTLQGTVVGTDACSIDAYFEDGQLGTVLTLSITEQDGEYILSNPTAPLPLAEQKQSQYHLQFEGFDIQEPSWVKVNSVGYDIKVYHHSENVSEANSIKGVKIKSTTIPDEDGHTRVFFDEVIDVPIPTTHPLEEQNLGKWFFKFKKQPIMKKGEDGTWENDGTSTTVYGYCEYPTIEGGAAKFTEEPVFTYQKSYPSRNYFCDVTFTPKNTDYFDGDLAYLSLHFRYDLSKSLALLSGNATFVDSGIVLPYGLAKGNYWWTSGVGTWVQDNNTKEFTYDIRKDELRTFKNEQYKGVYGNRVTITAPPFLQNKVFSDGMIPHDNYFIHNLKTGGSDLVTLGDGLQLQKVQPVTDNPWNVNANIPKVGGEWGQLREEFSKIMGSTSEPFNGRNDCIIHYLYKTNSHHIILDKENYPIYNGAELNGTLSVQSRLNKGGASVALLVMETELDDPSIKTATYQYISHLGEVGKVLPIESQVTKTKNKNSGLSEQPQIPSLTFENFTEFDIPSDRFVFIIGALNGRILRFTKPGYRTYDNTKWKAQKAHIKFTGGISPRTKGTNILEISLDKIQFTPPPNTEHNYGQFFVKMENSNQYYLDPYGRNLPIEVKPINKYGNDSDSPYLTISDAYGKDKWEEVNLSGFTERFSSCLPVYNSKKGYSRGLFSEDTTYELTFSNLKQGKYYVFACYIEDIDEQSQWKFSFNYDVLCLKGQGSSETLETRKTKLQILPKENNLDIENYIWKTSDYNMLTKYIRVCVVFKSDTAVTNFIVSAVNSQRGGAYIYNPIVYESQYDKHNIDNPDNECNKYDFMPLCIKDTTIENIPLGDNLTAYADCFIPLPYYELLSDY